MHNFRTQLLATTAMLVLSGTAYAADMAVKAPPAAPPPPVTNWTGFYVGGQIGGASFDPSCGPTRAPDGFPLSEVGFDPCQNFTDAEGVSHSGSLSSDSVLGGGRVGYDYQWGKVVLGVVGQFDWTHLDGTERTFNSFETGTVISASEQIDWLASARGRVGWAFDNVLFYATGGVAWTQIKASVAFAGPTFASFGGQSSSNKTGVVAGGGLEYRVTQNVSVFGELLWYGFGSTNVNAVIDGATYSTTPFNSQDILAGTVGVNWRF